jgi:regulator of sigma E protease
LGPRAADNDDGVYRLGILLAGVGLSPTGAARESLVTTGRVSQGIFTSLGRLVTGEGRKDISSPVGIVQGSSDAAKQSTNHFLWVLGLISLSIALLNLLPFLPLDGGHILFALLEKVYRRPIPRVVFERVSVVGIVLMLMLFTVGLNNDIGRIGNP